MTILRLGHRGHRMRRWKERENCFAAFDRALATGCDGLELDLRLSADGRVVVHHDDCVGSRRSVAIADASLRQLRRLQPELVTLDQVLRRYGAHAWLDLEIKAAAAAPAVVALVRRSPPRRGFVMSSFDRATLRALAALAPELPLCLNLRRPAHRRQLRTVPVQWIAPHHAACTSGYIRRLRSDGWSVLVWTVNRPARMVRFARAGANAIVSDDPELLVRTVPRDLECKQTVLPARHQLLE